VNLVESTHSYDLLVVPQATYVTLVVVLITLLLAVAVPALRNPMHSLLALIGVFLLAVLLYIVAGAEFLGLVFLIVYVGAVAILFLFVIMLLNVKALATTFTVIQRRSQVYALAAGVSCSLFLLALNVHAFTKYIVQDLALATLKLSAVELVLYYVNYGAADVMAFATLYTDQAALFLLITLVLLIAMLGAIVLATATLDEEEPLPVRGAEMTLSVPLLTNSTDFQATVRPPPQ